MSFNDYWKAKAAKRRKAWAAVAKRFADEHAQMEEIRKKVYIPLDYNNTFSFDGYKEDHLVEQNPIVKWDQMKCHFTENGLRDAMATEGADLANLTMLVSRESIVGVEAPCPQNRWEGFYLPNKVYDYEQVYHAWLKRVYGICTDVETVRLTYGEVTMTIKRYSKEGTPFGYYELNPCEQLTKAAMMLQETDFNMLNVATLLMEMEATWKLRQEELNYYAKKLRLRTMEAAVATDEIEFTLWDDKKLAKKVEEYIAKEYTINEVMVQLLRPYKAALNKYFDAAIERSLRDEVPTLRNFNYYRSNRDNRDNFFEQELRPLLEAELDGVDLGIKGKSDKTITITYHGCQCCLESLSSWLGIRLTPHVGYEKYTIPLSPSTPLSAIGGFVRQMPTINHRTDEYIVKAMQIYDKLMCQQNEEYHAVVEHLSALATKHAGKPVGMLMKYLRWSTASLLDKKGKWLYIPTIAVTGDTAFSYTEREAKDFLTSTYEDVFKEKWVDAECRYLYGADPETTDANEWIKAHSGQGVFRQARWAHDVRSFAGYGNDDTFLSVKFIHEKL